MHFYVILMTRLVPLNHLEWILRCIFPSQKAHNPYFSKKHESRSFRFQSQNSSGLLQQSSRLSKAENPCKTELPLFKGSLVILADWWMDWESASPSLSSSAHHSSSSRAFHLALGILTWKLGTCSLHLHKVNKSHPINPQNLLFCYRTFASSLPQT